MAASMAAAGANVVLNFIFIRLFGYIAAGYTTLACYMLYSVGHYIVSKRILVNEGIQENLMSPGFLVACSAFLIGASIICNLISRTGSCVTRFCSQVQGWSSGRKNFC